MENLQGLYFKGFSYDKYLSIASKDELEMLVELNKTVSISDELVEKIKKVNKKVKVVASVETWCPFARVFLTTIKKVNEVKEIFDLSLITYGRGIGEMAGYLKINEDDFVVPTAVFFNDDFSTARIFNGFPEKFHEEGFKSIGGRKNYLQGEATKEIIEDILKAL